MVATTKKIRINGQLICGYTIKLPNANLVLAVAKQGFVCCGYLDLATAQKLNDAAGVVRGVKNVEGLLKAKIVELTPQAMAFGIRLGMTGKEALALMSGNSKSQAPCLAGRQARHKQYPNPKSQ